MAQKMIKDGSEAAGDMFKSIRKGAIQPMAARGLYGAYRGAIAPFSAITAAGGRLQDRVFGSKAQNKLASLNQAIEATEDKQAKLRNKLGEDNFNNLRSSLAEEQAKASKIVEQEKLNNRVPSLKI